MLIPGLLPFALLLAKERVLAGQVAGYVQFFSFPLDVVFPLKRYHVLKHHSYRLSLAYLCVIHACANHQMQHGLHFLLFANA